MADGRNPLGLTASDCLVPMLQRNSKRCSKGWSQHLDPTPRAGILLGEGLRF